MIKWEKEVLRGTRQADITFEGSIEFEGERIEKLSASEIAKRGLMLCPERGRPFAEMTVRDNLLAGAYLCQDSKEVDKNFANVCELFPRLKERENQISGTLSGGERQMLCIGRALMRQPKFLLVDEPSSGLDPVTTMGGAWGRFDCVGPRAEGSGASARWPAQGEVRGVHEDADVLSIPMAAALCSIMTHAVPASGIASVSG